MGASSILLVTSPGNGCGGGGGAASKKSLKCWFRRKPYQHGLLFCFSPTFVFLFSAFLLFGLIASAYASLFFIPSARGLSSLGCEEDNEGSWSIGVFFGDSPFSLRPIEDENMWRNESAAWPVTNPVITCLSVSAAGFPSNFVADPFLYIQDDTFYLFYETKNSVSMRGDIGVSKSIDKGATWQQLGTVLNEDWHLSYPYVFNYLDKIYMMPESSKKGELRLYRALNFPLQWKLERVILKKPLVDAVMLKHGAKYWIFGSDHTAFGAKKNGQLEIWYGSSPLGPWKPHKQNPIYNVKKSFGARNGGRPFLHNGTLYRVGQDCGETYGRRIRTFRVEILNEDEFKEVEIPSGFMESKKGRNAWNGLRHHHLDTQQLSSGQWIAVMDGDRVHSGESAYHLIIGLVLVSAVAALVFFFGVLLGTMKCFIPLDWCPESLGKRSDNFFTWGNSNALSSKVLRLCIRLNQLPASFRVWLKSKSWAARLVVLAVICFSGVVLLCNSVKYIYGGNGAAEPYPVKGHFSEFTLLTMTYEARIWNLKMYVKHYSRCSSVKEIVVVWNKGNPPDPSVFDSAVPVRIRVEEINSLNNRFKMDPKLKTKAVLELDDDIMMTCDDIERGFKVWRDYPNRIVGFYPRLVDGRPLKYRAEKYARSKKGYNMILTGAAFLDSKFAFEKYSSEEAKEGRRLVSKFFNCEDLLLNYLYANASSLSTVEYVNPAWAIDTSKLSTSAISRNTKLHYRVRTECLMRFSRIYGSLEKRKSEFNRRNDGWDL